MAEKLEEAYVEGERAGARKEEASMSSCQKHYKGWMWTIGAIGVVALAIAIPLCLVLPDDDDSSNGGGTVIPNDSIYGWLNNDTGVPEGVDLSQTNYSQAIFDSMNPTMKMGQMNQFTYDSSATGPPAFSTDWDTAIAQGLVGSMFNMPNVSVCNHFQGIAQANGIPPILMGYDTIHGYWTIFPTNIGLGATFDTDLVRRTFAVAASEARSDGIHQAFSPMVDLSRDSRWGRLSESFGEDVCLTSSLGVAAVLGHKDVGHLSCVKHYAGYGGAESGRDYNLVDLSPSRMYGEYLQTYLAAINAGAMSVMTSFNTMNYVPATGNRDLLTNILKRAWGFKGLVVSDYTAVDELVNHGLGKDGNETSLVALRAGLDMEMAGALWAATLADNLNNGVITQDYIDAATQRILYTKESIGLGNLNSTDSYLTDESLWSQYKMNQSSLALAVEAAEKSMVLLHNGHPVNGTFTGSTRTAINARAADAVLPITDAVPKILIVGSLANSRWDQMGGWAGKGGDGLANVTTITNYLGCKRLDGSVADAADADSRPSVQYYPSLNDSAVNCTYLDGYWAEYGYNSSIINGTKTDAYSLLTKDIADFFANTDNTGYTHIIYAMGEPSNSSGEATSRAILEPCCGQQEIYDLLLETKAATTGWESVPVINVVFGARGQAIQHYVEGSSASIYAWFPGSMGGVALWNLLTDKSEQGFVGRLSVTVPRTAGQCPIYYARPWTGRPHDMFRDLNYPDSGVHYSSRYNDMRTEPLFNFGHGLSYGSIDYDAIITGPSTSSKADRSAQVSFSTTLRNGGSKDLWDIPQLYIHWVTSPASHPVRTMKAFQKVKVPAGGSVSVTFDMTVADFIYYDGMMRPIIDSTDYEIYIGPSNDPDWDRMTNYGYALSPGGNMTFTMLD